MPPSWGGLGLFPDTAALPAALKLLELSLFKFRNGVFHSIVLVLVELSNEGVSASVILLNLARCSQT